MAEPQHSAVTVLGLGAMGGALANGLLKRGLPVTVWNRSPDKAEALVEQGATFIPDLSAAIGASPVTIMCLSDHAACMSVLNGKAIAAAAGRTLIQLSTITSAESRELASRMAAASVRYLDGQILAYPDDILEARANLVCSGPPEVFNEHAATLRAMAGNVYHVGASHGAAPSFAKAHDSFSLGCYLSLLQGAAMCASSGVDLRAWSDYNLRYLSSGNLGREMAILADQTITRSYDEGLGATMNVWRGAAIKIVEECRTAGANVAHLDSLLALMDKSIAAGAGEKEIGVLFEQMTAK
ncbi:NAD(P)-dependent oxidoreductase [Aestuariivirga litoralis]|uniref:NAD(P)-dependent oxidoreductase n=1 Tax=Aestuariivirga litoralis TaxID=2650924 RepID=UPI0018C78577|nr:NAD(P)-binding domain-containing protein [Aestuariivirga litoralis]MBG1232642.1 NAD(P)-dependent oxidoreductase [Aestuariivirga litoralis]